MEEMFWGESNAALIDRTIPENWENESAIILYEKLYFNFDKKGNTTDLTEAIHKIILLNDDVAVEKFSEFSFNDHFMYRGENWLYGKFRIIKPNGNIEVLDEKDIIEKNEKEYFSIPNLEKGDVVDYYIFKWISYDYSFKYFRPFEVIIPDEYHKKHSCIEINVDPKYYLNFGEFNSSNGIKKHSNKKNTTYIYETKDVEKLKKERWSYLKNENHTVKFQVAFSPDVDDMKESRYFIKHKTNKPESDISREETDYTINQIFDRKKESKLSSAFVINVNGINYDGLKEIVNKKDKLHYFYNKYRRVNVKSLEFSVQRSVLDNNQGQIFSGLESDYFEYEVRKEIQVTQSAEFNFIQNFMDFLEENNYDFELLVGKQKYDGTMEDLVLMNNLKYLLKVNIENEVFIIDYPRINNSINELPASLTNTSLYAYKTVPESKKVNLVPNGTYQNLVANPNENSSKTYCSINTKNMSDIKVGIKSFSKGIFKRNDQNKLMSFLEIMEDEKGYFGSNYDKTGLLIISKKKKNSVEERMITHRAKID
ncbi:MAG: hypothetical protein ACPGSD_09450 [Flavobacteriales bacterium]